MARHLTSFIGGSADSLDVAQQLAATGGEATLPLIVGGGLLLAGILALVAMTIIRRRRDRSTN